MHRFCYHFGSFFGVISWNFPNFAKNATHHENAVNSSQIVGRAAMETRTIRYKIGLKTRSKTASQFRCFFKGFGGPFWKLFGAFWPSKAVPNSNVILGCSFVGFRDAAWLLLVVGGSSARLRRRSRCRGSPLGGAPFARGGIL